MKSGVLPLLPVLFLVGACSPKTKHYEGTMFIVTKGRQNINLGGSTLFIIREQDLALHIEDAETWTKQTLQQLADKARSEKEEREKAKARYVWQVNNSVHLVKKVASLRKEYEQKQAELAKNQATELGQIEAEARYAKNSDQYLAQVLLNGIKARYKADQDKLRQKYAGLISDAEAQYEKESTLEKQILAEAGSANREFEQTSDLTKNFNGLFLEYVFSKLPRPFLITRTDSDGKFKFEVPSSEKFALASRETRQVLDETETYFWYLHLPDSPTRPGDEVIFLDLTNSTTLSENYPGSVVRLPLTKFEVTE